MRQPFVRIPRDDIIVLVEQFLVLAPTRIFLHDNPYGNAGYHQLHLEIEIRKRVNSLVVGRHDQGKWLCAVHLFFREIAHKPRPAYFINSVKYCNLVIGTIGKNEIAALTAGLAVESLHRAEDDLVHDVVALGASAFHTFRRSNFLDFAVFQVKGVYTNRLKPKS